MITHERRYRTIRAALPNGAELHAHRAQINAEIEAMMQRSPTGQGPADGERRPVMGEVA